MTKSSVQKSEKTLQKGHVHPLKAPLKEPLRDKTLQKGHVLGVEVELLYKSGYVSKTKLT